MTKFGGLLLIDVPEDPIGDWENELGHRGMREVWHLQGKEHIKINIDPYEDCEECLAGECECWEVWYSNDEAGDWEPIGHGHGFDAADKIAKEYMRENPHG